jgi:hypothetical protein
VPIAKEHRRWYGREWRETIRPRILERAGSRCEECGKGPHMTRVSTLPGGLWFDPAESVWRAPSGPLNVTIHPRNHESGIEILVKIGVAHLDHNPANNADENLRALCARCHFLNDRNKHRDTRARHKDERRPLLALL